MSPTPIPTPTPSPLDGTSPSGLDDVLTEIAANNDPNAAYGEKLDAALDAVPRTIFGVDYVPDTGLIITASPVVLLVVTLVVVVGVLIAAVAVARRARRSDEPRGQFIAERERIAARERDALAKVTAAKAAEDGADR